MNYCAHLSERFDDAFHRAALERFVAGQGRFKTLPARMPDISRIVVPLLPQSSGCDGAIKPVFPTPSTVTVLPSRSILTPRAAKAFERRSTIRTGRKILDPRRSLGDRGEHRGTM